MPEAKLALMLLVCMMLLKDTLQHQHQQRNSTEILLETATRFEAVGRISEARARVLEAQTFDTSHPMPAVALQRLDAGASVALVQPLMLLA